MKPKGAKTRNLELKRQIVEDLKEKINSSNAQILVNLCGLTVEETTEIRKELKKLGAKVQVVKNTLARIAAEDTPLKAIEDKIVGPTAIVFSYGDPVEVVKSIVKFDKELEKFDVKGAILEGKPLTKEQVIEVSKLPPREVLLAKLVGTLQAPLYGFVGVLAANLRNLVGVLYAIKEAKEKQQ
ncbi:large subunit ribosomal protein L10 [Thermosulfidibacter takaii ABI70S6]|uniref:Large ribosomal subunit protein uL10 n=1 Tax=Thermosulfidibacter takaii (strain DSM 17441 / JCM 13301 / NBRC 103674 / ABI70S6) TaxID=1298851 RepID=A0A0S3QV80_THET7|nr:50S ribosomal protein L10 [Thermosulfidibacter takaii]BAT72231.1 large subunit ribosomal protein L10 [Thermosulfidibacter takaii ABI70S6]